MLPYDKKTVSTYGVIVALTILGLWIVKAFDISYPLTLLTSARSSELAVTGEGKVDVVPDTAYVDVGISVNNARSVSDAQKTVNDTNNKIIAAMKNLGIKKDDIKTANYSIFPNYSYDGGKNKINGYNASVTISIKVIKIDQVSAVISTATASGANQVQGARFVIDKPEVYREKAREAAIKNARDQAAKLGKQLGIRISRVVNIVETTSPDLPPVYARSLSSEGIGGGSGPEIQPGTQTITSTVTLYFEKR